MAKNSLAFDRASVRSVDQDGHLHISLSNISKVAVNPYRGAEIPGYAELGLDADKVYQLFRDPEELAKAALTFDGKPLMIVHRPINAEDHAAEIVVGAVSNPVFEAPYLKAAMTVWPGEAIDAIEDGSQREISCGYHYEPDMTPGTYNGVKFDGVMRNIRGNHVALVEAGRAGSDVVVGDSKLENLTMPKVALKSRTALRLEGALSTYLKPKLAKDQKIALDAVLKDVTAKNFKAQKPAIIAAIEKAAKGKLAADASLDDMHKFVDSMTDEQGRPASDEDDMIEDAEETPEAKAAREKAAKDAEMDKDKKAAEDADEPKAFLKSKLSAEDMKAYDEMCAAKTAKDALMGSKSDGKVDAAVNARTDKLPGMDAKAVAKAITIATDAARSDTIVTMNAIADAEREVRPLIGELKTRPVSAEAVYKLALDSQKIDTAGVPPAAYRAMVRMLPKPGTNRREVIALDSDTPSITKFIPGLENIRLQ